ncbi:MAG: hypothetical protein CVV21_08275 [Candidatus Goldiibacteriota bacterium HGW-Goldbacteria-1]|jgi:hypothetical protein|nr:MAG: hypothetical protein CVV21_08275 [Candidatus Goldiibacteriota bacterium HGW-Goldbacteria-1]
MHQVMIKEKKYQGKYVAVKSMKDTKVIASGSSMKIAFDKAVKTGVEKPLLIYVPEKNTVHIY